MTQHEARTFRRYFVGIVGENSDLLIHEATFEDDLLDEAQLKLHSTTSEAINVAQDMKAKCVILTHFSQRYSKVPYIADTLGENTGIAFDNMEVSTLSLSIRGVFT